MNDIITTEAIENYLETPNIEKMKKNEKNCKILTGSVDIALNSFITIENEKSKKYNLLPCVWTRELVKDTLEIMRDKIK